MAFKGNMMEQQYKGFEIAKSNIDGRFKIYTCSDDFKPCEGFNPDGYATLNNAKGAITKYLKSSVAAAIVETLNVPVGERMQAIKAIVRKIPSSNPKHMSRNKREGVFVGRSDGKVDRWTVNAPYNVASFSMRPRTRKQRKLAEINFKNKQK